MKNEYIVIIDPAHGGNDSGENYNNFHEKDYCLYMANYLKNIFNNEKITTKLTRNIEVRFSKIGMLIQLGHTLPG